MTYAEAEALMRTARSQFNGKPLRRHTQLIDHGAYFAVRYHWTNVVEICRNGACYLRSGGYRTLTTKRRINQYLPFGWHLYQENFEWYVSHGSKTYLFRSGFRIGPRGGCKEKRKK